MYLFQLCSSSFICRVSCMTENINYCLVNGLITSGCTKSFRRFAPDSLEFSFAWIINCRFAFTIFYYYTRAMSYCSALKFLLGE